MEFEILREIYEDERIYIVRVEDIEKSAYLHDAYNEYGKKWDAEGAGDYSLHNTEGDWAFCDMIKEGVKTFGEVFSAITIDCNDLTVENYDELEGIEAGEKEINQWIKDWEKENANYTTADYITWWNGHNFQTCNRCGRIRSCLKKGRRQAGERNPVRIQRSGRLERLRHRMQMPGW